ncbi:MAG TPA: PilZ domain-containing protein [Candidatus Baltobacteraceae bacterium]|nr:PilZ domain-containing protein [Candidatus Baltobacteraceae bacterium]
MDTSWEGLLLETPKRFFVDREHREFERVGDTLLVSYSISDDFPQEFTETYDIAVGGISILTNAEIAREAPVFIQLELRGDTRPMIRLRGVVRWSRMDPALERYRTGIAFTDMDDATRNDVARYIDTLKLLRDMQ